MNPPVVKKCKNAHLLFKKLQGLVTNCNEVISYSGISFGIRCPLTTKNQLISLSNDKK